MPTLNDVIAGSLAQAVQLQQVIDALKGTPNKGVPIALVSLNDQNNYALTVQNDDPTNSRALSVLKADGSTLISADATGVTLGSPLSLPAGGIGSAALAANSVSQRAFAQITSGSTTSTSFVDIPSFSASLTTTGGDLLAFACVNLAASGSTSAFLALNLDGTDTALASVQCTGVFVMEAVMVYRWAAPSAGAHTIKGRWSCSPSVTMQINANVNSTLLIMEMKK